ncbi:MAG: hypothetical protein H7839_19135 [Magnetococcus sp. YQC-5]
MIATILLFYFFTILPWTGLVRQMTGEWRFFGDGGSINFNVMTIENGQVTMKSNDYLSNKYNNISTYSDQSFKSFFINLNDIIARIKLQTPKLIDLMINALRNALTPLIALLILFFFFKTNTTFKPIHWSIEKTNTLISFLIFISPMPIILSYYFVSRYYMPYLPILHLPIAFLIVRLWTIIPIRQLFLISLTVAIFVIHLTIPLPGIPYQPDLVYYLNGRAMNKHWGARLAGEWLKDHCQPLHAGQKLRFIALASAQYISFYFTGKNLNHNQFTQFSKMDNEEYDLQQVGNALNTGQFDYFIIDKFYMLEKPALAQQLWDNPTLAEQLGMAPIHFNERFQIYGPSFNPNHKNIGIQCNANH